MNLTQIILKNTFFTFKETIETYLENGVDHIFFKQTTQTNKRKLKNMKVSNFDS